MDLMRDFSENMQDTDLAFDPANNPYYTSATGRKDAMLSAATLAALPVFSEGFTRVGPGRFATADVIFDESPVPTVRASVKRLNRDRRRSYLASPTMRACAR